MSQQTTPLPAVVQPPALPVGGRGRGRATTVLFALTSFTGAALLFVVQPMVARLVLPSFGGSAAVWSTSSLFFQLLLLVGYLYVHVSTRRLGPRRQPLLHLGVLLLPLVALPVALPPGAAPSGDVTPALWLLWVLALVVGLPFAVLSTTGPLLQRWYSWTGTARAEDPYFLFATSNLGSFGGLLAYPFVVEPLLSLREQRLGWSAGFLLLLLLVAACAVTARRGQGRTRHPDDGPTAPTAEEPAAEPPAGPDALTPRLVLGWLALAFLPSTLMLGVTAHVSTDVAAIPLLWVVPLAIYLATFVVAFARAGRQAPGTTLRLAAGLATVALLVQLAGATRLPMAAAIGLDLAVLASAAYAAHRALAVRRPTPHLLTAFYLVVAAGGALGGLLNGLLAPLVLTDVWEYPLALLGVVLLGTLLPQPFPARLARFHPGVLRAAEVALVLVVLLAGAAWTSEQDGGGLLVVVGVVAVPAGLAVLGSRRPTATVLALSLALAGSVVLTPDPLYRDRTFYGTYRVAADGDQHVFSHGTTIHGTQLTGERRREPTSYYARQGPVGDVFALGTPAHTGVVGLGVGTMAAHVGAGQRLTFVEIDEEVVRVASDPRLFTYLADTAAEVEVVVDDGRLALSRAEPGTYDVLVLDAFSSDAIPVHLLTEEAFAVYDRALADDGILLVHVSNRVFDLEPVVAHHAERLGWAAAVGTGRTDGVGVESLWVALSPDPDHVARLLERPQWREPGTAREAWTDDFSSVLSVLK
ncbi:spermidine synthase [Nocardioides solisilvae]|uniref:spermidine synthase n=1 Tax=Nocardioides solisilvae TaxID=1542435 RepID=UPI000D746459|nr:fused MFS/spermidine synthase [Nocardioides solisilvae]